MVVGQRNKAKVIIFECLNCIRYLDLFKCDIEVGIKRKNLNFMLLFNFDIFVNILQFETTLRSRGAFRTQLKI